MRKLNLKHGKYGFKQRLMHQENELENAPIVPVPVEYEDIDNCVIEFFDSSLNLSDDKGNKIPIFKLLSNQRFSEYSQTWEHSDKDGNLLMNFKTLNREVNPSCGTIHGGMANIPGDTRFTVLMREIIDDTGVECYEITSMSQPLAVDLKYTVTFVTSKLSMLNEFNKQVIALFKSKQCYVYPNGHAMPMLLDNIGDESSYDINNRKFYSQPVTINLLAYIIPKDDIRVELKPKNKKISTDIEKFNKTFVDMEMLDDDNFKLNVRFKPGVDKIKFSLEDKVKLKLKETVNARNIKLKVNGDDYSFEGDVKVNPDEEISIKINKNFEKISALIIEGTFI